MEKTAEQAAAEEYLRRLRKIGKQIRAIDEEIKQLRTAAQSAGAINYDRDRVKGGAKEDRLILFISDIMEFQVKREELHIESDSLKEKSYSIIRNIQDAQERIFLESYYINASSMNATISKMYVSERKAYYIKDNALQHFGELMKKSAAV